MNNSKLYKVAKKKLEKINEFHRHVTYFVFLIPFILAFVYFYFQTLIIFWSILLIWSLVILGQFFYVYDIYVFFFGRRWKNPHLDAILSKQRKKRF